MVEFKKIPLDKIFLVTYSLALLSLAIAAKKIVFDFIISDGGAFSSTPVPQSATIYGGLLILIFCFSAYWTYSSFKSKDISNIERSLISGVSVFLVFFSWNFYIIKFAERLSFGYFFFLIYIGLSVLFLIGIILTGIILSKMDNEKFREIVRTLLWVFCLFLIYISLNILKGL